jgi:hypothetical protein
MKTNLFLIAMISTLSLGSCKTKTDVFVQTQKDKNGNWEILLENSKIKIRYGYKIIHVAEGMITDLYMKAFPEESLEGWILDGAAHRGVITNAEVVKDSVTEKTVRVTWAPHKVWAKRLPGPAISEFTIYPDSQVLKIHYVSFYFPHICDIGLYKDTVNVADCGGAYSIYGFKKDSIPLYEDCLYWVRDSCMGCFGKRASLGYAIDPSPLLYKGWFIMAVYKKDNQHGFARVFPANNIICIKLLWNKGFEIFPKHNDLTCYLYPFSNGGKEAVEFGKKLVDKLNP